MPGPFETFWKVFPESPLRAVRFFKAHLDGGLTRENYVLLVCGPKAVRDALEICRRVQTRPFLLFGTLRGFALAEDFLPTSRDIDLGLSPDDFQKKNHIKEMFIKKGYKFDIDTDYMLQIEHPKFQFFTIDFFCVYKDRHNACITSGSAQSSNCLTTFTFPRHVFDALSPVTFYGRKTFIPAQAEEYLTVHYGNQWKDQFHKPHYSQAKHVRYEQSDFLVDPKPKDADTPDITVLICTYNRQNDIKDLLEGLLAQRTAENFTFEVLVADNNSTDQTRAAIEAYIPKFQGRLRYLFEGRQGKAYALNLGIKEARGDIIAFIDDDCLIGDDYLANLYKVFAKYGLEVGMAGGRIGPHWVNGGPPQWFLDLQGDPLCGDFFNGPLGILDYGSETFVMDPARGINKGRLFYGANTAIRRYLLERHGYYQNSQMYSEDTEICMRLYRAGVKGAYAPEVMVKHKIQAQKITPDFYYRWFYLRGEYLGAWDYTDPLWSSYKSKFFYPFGISIWTIRQTIGWILQSWQAKELGPRLRLQCLTLFGLGQMKNTFKNNIL